MELNELKLYLNLIQSLKNGKINEEELPNLFPMWYKKV